MSKEILSKFRKIFKVHGRCPPREDSQQIWNLFTSSLWTRGLLGSGLKLLCPGEHSLYARIFQGSVPSVCRLKDHGRLYSPRPCSENVLSAASTQVLCVPRLLSSAGDPQERRQLGLRKTWSNRAGGGKGMATEVSSGEEGKIFFFFNSEKQLPCIFVFYVSSCRSFYFFLIIKIVHASQRKNIFRQSRKREERSQYNSISLRQSP